MKTFYNDYHRNLLLTALVFDPSMRECLRTMLRMGAKRIRADHMYVRQADGSYKFSRDPGAWIGYLYSGDPNSMHIGIMMLRDKDGNWFLNGE